MSGGRKFKDPTMQQAYDGHRKDPPVLFYGTTGKAYRQGLEHPDDPPRLIAPGTQQYACWAAGVDNARAAREAARAVGPVILVSDRIAELARFERLVIAAEQRPTPDALAAIERLREAAAGILPGLAAFEAAVRLAEREPSAGNIEGANAAREAVRSQM